MFRKVALLALAMSAAMMLVACNTEKKQAPKPAIIVIDQEVVYRESDAAKAAVTHLDALSRELQTRLIELQAATRTSEDKDKAEEAFEAGLNELQQQFAAEQQQVTNKVTELSEKAIDSVRKEAGASMVIGAEVVLARDAAIDMTSKVIAEMNKTKLTFTRVDAQVPATNGTAPAEKPATPATAQELAPAKEVPATTNSTAPAATPAAPAVNATAK